MKKKIFLLFLFLQLILSDDYSEVFKCKTDGRSKQEIREALDRINMRNIDSWFFVIGGPLCLFSEFLVIFTFLKYKEMRKPPGDILFAISVSEMILTIHWMISSERFFSDPKNPPTTNGDFCMINSYFSVFSGTCEFTYNCWFCIFLILKIRNILTNKAIPKIFPHILCILISIVFVMILALIDNLGKSLFGTCSIKGISQLPIGGPAILLIYCALSVAAIVYFRKTVPNDKKFLLEKTQFLDYYYKYVQSILLLWGIIAISNLMGVLNCMYFQKPVFNILLTIGDISKLGSPIILSIIRFQDPFIRNQIKKFIRNKARQECPKNFLSVDEKNIIDESFEREDGENYAMILNKESSGREKSRKDQALQLFDEDEDEEKKDVWINIIRENMKLMLTYIFLTGILMHYNNISSKESINDYEVKQSSKHSSTIEEKFVIYNISDESIKRILPEAASELSDNEFSELDTKLKVFNPEVFKEILLNDYLPLDLHKSLDLSKNADNIKKASASAADGGKGGAFFFFSNDSKVIIKTLSQQDHKVLSNNINKYRDHLINNPKSLIAKILGVYQYKNKNIQNATTLILMKNILNGFPKYCVERTFDMKGSTYSREVLVNKDSNINLAQITLKDLDFLKLEKQIYIEEHLKLPLFQAIENDAKFFKNCGIIDYSLIVFKINRNYFLDFDVNQLEEEKESLNFLKSTKEEGIYYHLGIIDYLQEYDIKKTVEKYGKKLMKFNINLDTSSQDPDFYAKRFIDFIRKIIFDKE